MKGILVILSLAVVLSGCSGSDSPRMTEEQFNIIKAEMLERAGVGEANQIKRVNVSGIDCIVARPDFRSVAISCDWNKLDNR